MKPETETMLVHIACALAIALCLTLAATVLKPFPYAAGMLVSVSFFLYGKLGFRPADAVLARVLQKIGPAEVARLSSRPPAGPLSSLTITATAAGPIAKGDLVVFRPSGAPDAEDKTPVVDVVPKP